MTDQLKAAGKTAGGMAHQNHPADNGDGGVDPRIDVAPDRCRRQEFYDEHPTDFELPEKVHVRHILLLTMDSYHARAAARRPGQGQAQAD